MTTQCITKPVRGARKTKLSLAGLSMALLASCQIQQCFPQEVGDGAARLSVRNSAKLISLISNDTKCGFSSDAVKSGYVVEGSIGEEGAATWTVTDCELDYGDEPKLVDTDCQGIETRATGKLKVSATRRVEGLLTGNSEQPIIPLSPDAVTMAVTADVEGYSIRFSDKVTVLMMKKAHLEEEVSIHLAQSAELGLCSVPTSAPTLHRIHVTDAQYAIDSGDKNFFDVDVAELDIEAQVGPYGDHENYIGGKITVWDNEIDLSHDKVLDPDYKLKEFLEAEACSGEAAVPLTYECQPLWPKLAEGAARLSANNVGNLVSVIVDDMNCGFPSPQAIASAVVTGEEGREGGKVVYTVTDCEVNFPSKAQIAQNCTGITTYAQGRAKFTGTKTVFGRLTGNPDQPIIPTSRDPAVLSFTIEFDHFAASSSATDNSLEVTGTIEGEMRPRVALDELTGACSITTPVVQFDNLSYQPGTKAVLRSGGNSFELNIEGSQLNATNGEKNGHENYLDGTILVNGESYDVPFDGSNILDPDYDADAFDAGYACKANMRVVDTDEECNFRQVIADGAARLTVATAGKVASLVNASTDGGFDDTLGVLLFPTEVEGSNGEMGSMTWDATDCDVGNTMLTVTGTDCNGANSYQQGRATVQATRKVVGMRDKVLLEVLIDSVIPTTPHSVTIDVHEALLSEFVTYTVPADADGPQGKLTIHSGTLSATVEPATGKNASTLEDETVAYDVATPIARLSNIHLTNASATLESSGMKFHFTIDDADLSATNGSFLGKTNAIAGTITIDGDELDISGALDPSYNAADFDDSYVCTENLVEPLRL